MGNQNVEERQQSNDSNGQRTFINKLMNICVTVATGCLMIIVGFIWEIRKDFSAQQTKMENLEQKMNTIVDDIRDLNNGVNDLKTGSARMEERVNALEKKVDKLDHNR